MKETDALIIGGSAAGLTAGLFAARRGLSTTIITKDLGGQMASTLEIENYPGLMFTEGYSLAETMAEQARRAGARLWTDEVVSLSRTGGGRPLFVAAGAGGRRYEARSLIIALGKTPRSLGLEREGELLGRGVGYCAPSDIKNAAGQRVVIVGGGGTAFAAARLGADLAEHITLVNRSATFRAEKAVMEDVAAKPNVEILTDSQVVALRGEDRLSGVTIRRSDGDEHDLPCELLLIGAGYVVQPELYRDLVDTNDLGQIKINPRQETSCPGLFAAGDVTDVPFNQAVVSAGEGAKAGLAAYTWLTGKPAGADWG